MVVKFSTLSTKMPTPSDATQQNPTPSANLPLFELGLQDPITGKFATLPRRLYFKNEEAVCDFINTRHQPYSGLNWIYLTHANKVSPTENQPLYVDFDTLLKEVSGGDKYEALLVEKDTGTVMRPFKDRSWRFGTEITFQRIAETVQLNDKYEWTRRTVDSERPCSPKAPATSTWWKPVARNANEPTRFNELRPPICTTTSVC